MGRSHTIPSPPSGVGSSSAVRDSLPDSSMRNSTPVPTRFRRRMGDLDRVQSLHRLLKVERVSAVTDPRFPPANPPHCPARRGTLGWIRCPMVRRQVSVKGARWPSPRRLRRRTHRMIHRERALRLRGSSSDRTPRFRSFRPFLQRNQNISLCESLRQSSSESWFRLVVERCSVPLLPFSRKLIPS